MNPEIDHELVEALSPPAVDIAGTHAVIAQAEDDIPHESGPITPEIFLWLIPVAYAVGLVAALGTRKFQEKTKRDEPTAS